MAVKQRLLAGAGPCGGSGGAGAPRHQSLNSHTVSELCKERHLSSSFEYFFFFFCKPLLPVLFSIYTSHLVLRKHWWFGVLVVSDSIFIYKENPFSR